jgi:MFS family permease
MAAHGFLRSLRWRVLRQPAFRRFWVARTISLLGDGVLLTALTLYLARRHGSALSIAGVLFARSAPRLLGLVAGAFADRHDRRRLMLLCDAGQCVIYVVITVVLPGDFALAVLIAPASIFATLFATCSDAAMPTLVTDDELSEANVWLGASTNLEVAIGPLLAGAVVVLAGFRWAFLLDAMTFLISFGLLLRTRELVTERRRDDSGILRLMGSGLLYVRARPMLWVTMLMLTLAIILLSVDSVGLVLLTRRVLHASAFGYGVAAAAFGAGMIASSLALIVFTLPGSSLVQLVGALMVGGLALSLTGIAPALVAIAAFQILGGVGNGIENVASATFFQRHVESDMRGRVFGVLIMATFGAMSLGAPLGGVLADLIGIRGAFLIGGVGAIVVVACAALFLAHQRQTEST